MSVYYCHQCDQYHDADTEGVEEGPDGDLWCPPCFNEYVDDMQPTEAQEWYDYDPYC